MMRSKAPTVMRRPNIAHNIWIVTFFLLACLTLLTSCSEDKGVDAGQLSEHSDGLVYYADEDKPFSGKAVEQETHRRCEFYVKNGRQDGSFTVWGENGNIIYKSWYKKGVLHGKATSWYINGDLKREAKYDNGTMVWEKSHQPGK